MATKTTNKRQNFRDELKRIDAFLAGGGEQAIKLWNVLSALRGPDYLDTALKRKTTARIRAIAFPLTSRRGTMTALFNREDKGPILLGDRNRTNHFAGHIYDAAEALNRKVV